MPYNHPLLHMLVRGAAAMAATSGYVLVREAATTAAAASLLGHVRVVVPDWWQSPSLKFSSKWQHPTDACHFSCPPPLPPGGRGATGSERRSCDTLVSYTSTHDSPYWSWHLKRRGHWQICCNRADERACRNSPACCLILRCTAVYLKVAYLIAISMTKA